MSIVIIGHGVLKKRLIEIAKVNKSLNNKIYFIDFINYDNLFDTIVEAKIGLIILDPINKSKEYALANKISEYMLCGIPPLLSNHIEHVKLLKKNDLGFLIKSYEPEEIANRINKIILDENLLNKKSKIARSEFENLYNWDLEKQAFIKHFEKLITK